MDALKPGATLGRYAVLRPRRTGVAGEYLAFDPELDRTVNLEVQGLAPDEREPARSRGRQLAGLQHPSLAALHESGEAGEAMYVARERPVGADLRTWLGAGRGWSEIRDALVPALRALAVLHDAGLVHGRLDAGGILVTNDGRGVLTPPVFGVPDSASAASDRAAMGAVLRDALSRASDRPPTWLTEAADADHPNTRAMGDAVEHRRPARARRTLAVAGVIGVGLVAGAAFLQTRSAGSQICTGADELVEGVWDLPTRELVRSSITASELPFAATVADSVEKALDRYTQAWVETRTTACRATRVDGTSDEAELDARMACLERRLNGVAARVEVLRDSDSTVVRNATRTVYGLEPVATCLDARGAPHSAEAGPLHASLERARALRDAGKYTEAATPADDAVSRARALGDDDLLAQALAVRAGIHWQDGMPEEAVVALEDAVGAAWRHGDHGRAAQAWGNLVYVRAEYLHDYAGGQRARQHALASLERAGNPPDVAASIEGSLGVLAFREGLYENAIEHYQRALEGHRKTAPDDVLLQASAMNNMANAMIRELRDEEALELHAEVLRIRTEHLGETHPVTAATLESMAAAHHGAGDLELALEKMKRVHAIRLQVLGLTHPRTGQSLANIGAVAAEMGRWDEAAAALEAALRHVTERDGPNHADNFSTRLNLAAVARGRENPTAALAHCEAALEVALAAFGDEHPDRATADHCAGQVLVDLERYDDAIVRFDRAAALREKVLGPTDSRVAYSLTASAGAMRRAGRPAEALPRLERALELHRAQDSDDVGLRTTRYELARSLWATGEVERARTLIPAALRGFRQGKGRRSPEDRVAMAWLEAHGG